MELSAKELMTVLAMIERLNEEKSVLAGPEDHHRGERTAGRHG